jgi:hypothetical protein
MLRSNGWNGLVDWHARSALTFILRLRRGAALWSPDRQSNAGAKQKFLGSSTIHLE